MHTRWGLFCEGHRHFDDCQFHFLLIGCDSRSEKEGQLEDTKVPRSELVSATARNRAGNRICIAQQRGGLACEHCERIVGHSSISPEGRQEATVQFARRSEASWRSTSAGWRVLAHVNCLGLTIGSEVLRRAFGKQDAH